MLLVQKSLSPRSKFRFLSISAFWALLPQLKAIRLQNYQATKRPTGATIPSWVATIPKDMLMKRPKHWPSFGQRGEG